MQTGADHELGGPVVELGEIPRRGHGGGTLVGGGVGDGQGGELGDGGLVLEHHLQPPLGDLWLVGGVGGEELGALREHVDQGGDVVVIHPGPEEAQLVLCAGVAGGKGTQVLVDILLRQPRGEVQVALEAHPLGDLAVEDLPQGVNTDRREHRGEVLRCDCCVSAQLRGA